MRHPIHGTSSRFRNRFQTHLAMLICGVVILGGGTSFAEEAPRKKASRKAASSNGLPPRQTFNRDVPEPPYEAFTPHSSASGEDLDFQKEIARILCSQAKSYPAREQHFNWLANDPLFQKAVHRVYGLNGYILEAEKLPGGWHARVSVRPSVAAVGHAVIDDCIIEDYRYQNGVLTLIQTDAAMPKPDKQRIRLH